MVTYLRDLVGEYGTLGTRTQLQSPSRSRKFTCHTCVSVLVLLTCLPSASHFLLHSLAYDICIIRTLRLYTLTIVVIIPWQAPQSPFVSTVDGLHFATFASRNTYKPCWLTLPSFSYQPWGPELVGNSTMPLSLTSWL